MAFWVIRGNDYYCSECQTLFNNYYRNVSNEKNCPCCGEPIRGEDRNEQRNLCHLRPRRGSLSKKTYS